MLLKQYKTLGIWQNALMMMFSFVEKTGAALSANIHGDLTMNLFTAQYSTKNLFQEMLFVYAELFINLIFRTWGPVAELDLIGCV